MVPISLRTTSSPDLLYVAIAMLLLLFELLCVRLLALAEKPFIFGLLCVGGKALYSHLLLVYT